MANATVEGMLTLDELGRKAASGELTTVLVVFPDLYGRFMGKRVPAKFFVESVAAHDACLQLPADRRYGDGGGRRLQVRKLGKRLR